MGHTSAAVLTLLGHFLFHGLTVLVQAQHNFDPTIRQRGHLRNTKNKDGMVMRDHDDGSKQRERNLQLDDCSAQFEIQIQFDDYAYEVYWELYTEVFDGDSYYGAGWGGSYDDSSNGGSFTDTFCIPSGPYNFTMYDSAEDGVCCGFGQGFYKVFVDDSLLKEGGEYGSQERTSFEVIKVPTISPAPTATPTAAPTVICSSDEATLAVGIMLDYSSDGISWNVTNADGALVLSSGQLPSVNQYATVYRQYCLAFGVYTFNMNNEYGNGGSYDVSVDGVEIIQGTMIYGSESTDFATANTPTPAPTSAPTIQCNSDESPFELILKLDRYPTEVSWNLTNSDKDVVLEGGNYSYDQGMKIVNVQICLPQSLYTFTIIDAASDGICCFYGKGFYTLYVGGNQVKDGRGDYGKEEVTIFATQDATLWPTTSPQPSTSPTVTTQPTPLWTSWPTPSVWTSFPTPSSWTSWPTPLWTSSPTWPAPTPAPTVACATDEATFELDIKFDYGAPNATSWDLADSGGNVVLSGQDYPDYSWEQSAVHKEACLSAGSYVFTIYDDDGNGLCCMNGPGMYKVTMDGVVVKKGGVFGSQESTNIVSAPSRI